ncbi:cytochrome P450 [Curtobacterium sp. MCPF17_050]|uniref:cytochrome P450 n=1 Tax=Curtobacterium sp. MCPF17_050 TaxID=2175664 RepID=UPI000D84E7AA|nr:cytochrome P450 [Curtobacterium sp. MCPF17_050]WIB16962.1 cytochrome P450 [Curtobacterium sp. MCPF17_050]
MTGIDARAARRATREDRRVVLHAHRAGYLALRGITRLGRVVRVPGLGVVVSDAARMRQILLDPVTYSKVGPGGSDRLWTPIIGPRGLLNMDGEEHAHLRRKLTPLFSQRFLRSIVDEVLTPEMDRFEDAVGRREDVDVVAVIERAAALIICRLTGYPEDDAAAQLARAREILGFVTLTTKEFSDAQLAVVHEKLAVLNASTRAAYRAAAPGTVPALMRAEGITEEDTVSVVTAMIVAGTETIVSFVPRFTNLVIESGHLDHLARHPEDVPAAVAEAMRVTVPSPVMIRSVLRDHRVDGIRVRAGERIILANIFACARAGDFDPSRPVPKEMRQLWFGAGAHFCIGMPLATLEAEVFAAALARAAAAAGPLRVRSRVRKQRTMAASYSRLVVRAERTP